MNKMEAWTSDVSHSSHPVVRIASPISSENNGTKCPDGPELITQHRLCVPQKQIMDLRRTSLHGKPIPVRQCRTDVRYRRLQAKIYNFLERPKTWRSMIYHVVVFACVFTCLQFSVLSTLKDYEKIAGISLFYLEMFMLFWFFAEYCIRVWSAGCRSRYQTWRGRLRFMHRPFCLVDATVIIASIVVLSMGTDSQRFAASPLRGLRFFQILRMIRMDRRGGSWKLLASVVWAHRQELFTTVYIGFLGLISSSFLVYLLERDVNDKIKSYADALWWGVVTLCTVGYGDTVPKTWMGKMVAACCAVAGISFFALPAGILGSGFALKVQQHQREKHLIRRRVPAATLIQCLWRCYAADVDSTSVATWKIHMRPLKCTTSEYFDKAPGRLARFTTVKKKVQTTTNATPLMSPDMSTNPTPTMNRFATFASFRSVLNDSIATEGSSWKPGLRSRTNRITISPEEHSDSTPDIRYPDSIKSDPESYPDQNGLVTTPTSEVTFSPTDRGGLTKSIRNNLGLKLKFRTLAHTVRSHINLSSVDSSNCLSQSMDSPTGVLEEDMEGLEPPLRILTNADKNVIRSIRKIKFFVARRKFREALRPYDVKDVIEQYSAGHLDMLGRIKILQTRLDQILGRTGTKEENPVDSQTTLASRIIKIEQKITGIETKLNVLISLHTAHQNGQYTTTSNEWSKPRESSGTEFYQVYQNPPGGSCFRRTGKIAPREPTNMSVRQLSLPEEDVNIQTIKEEVDPVTEVSMACMRIPPTFSALADNDDSTDEIDVNRTSVVDHVPLSIAHGPHCNVSSDDLLNISQMDVYLRESEVSSATSDTSLPHQVRDLDLQSNSPVSSTTHSEGSTNVIVRQI